MRLGLGSRGCKRVACGRQPRVRGAEQGWRLRQNKWGVAAANQSDKRANRSSFRDHLPIPCSQDITRSLDALSIRESIGLFLEILCPRLLGVQEFFNHTVQVQVQAEIGKHARLPAASPALLVSTRLRAAPHLTTRRILDTNLSNSSRCKHDRRRRTQKLQGLWPGVHCRCAVQRHKGVGSGRLRYRVVCVLGRQAATSPTDHADSSAAQAGHDPKEQVAVKKITNVFSKQILAKRALREIKLLQHFRGHRNVCPSV